VLLRLSQKNHKLATDVYSVSVSEDIEIDYCLLELREPRLQLVFLLA